MDQHSNPASLGSNKRFHSSFQRLCRYGFFHHNNSTCKDLIRRLRKLQVRQIILLQYLGRHYLNHLHYSLQYLKNNSYALLDFWLLHYHFCTVMGAMQWFLKSGLWFSDIHYPMLLLPIVLRLHTTSHIDQHDH